MRYSSSVVSRWERAFGPEVAEGPGGHPSCGLAQSISSSTKRLEQLPTAWQCQVIAEEPEGGPGWVSEGIVSGGQVTPGRDTRVLREPGRHWEGVPPGQHPGTLEGESRQECGGAAVILGMPVSQPFPQLP